MSPGGGRHWNRSFLPVADPGVPSRRTAAERFAPPEDSSSTSPCGAQTEETMPSDGEVQTHMHTAIVCLGRRCSSSRRRNKCSTSQNKALSVSINTCAL